MLKKIFKTEFSQNVLTLLTGTTIAQIIPLALTPVLSRLLSPEEFGLFALYMSFVMFFLVISTGRYELAILLPKEDKEAINIMAISFFILIIISSVLFLVVLLFENNIVEFIQKPVLKGWLIFIPFGVFSASSYRILTYWSNRKKRFKNTSVSVITQASSRSGITFAGGLMRSNFLNSNETTVSFFKSIFEKSYQIPSGVTPIGIGGFIIGYSVGFFLAFLTLLYNFIKKDNGLLQEINKPTMKKMARKYDKFPKINSLHAISDELKNSGVNGIISYLFSDIILGFYSMTFRILKAPLSVIGNSFGQVFFQKSAEMNANKQDFTKLIKSTIKKLSLIALPFFTLILLFGPQLFSFVLGEKWQTAGEYAQYLTPWLFLNFILSPVMQIPVVINKQKELFYLSITGNIIILGSIFIGAYVFQNIKHGFLLLSIFQTFYYFYCYLWVMKITKEHCKNF